MFQTNLACSVILYDSDLSVLENIETYNKFFSIVYVFDNSATPNGDLVQYFGQSKSIRYISFCVNYGVAYALNYVCNEAYQDGYDWILTMDQDSYFLDSHFFEMFKPYLSSAESTAIISAANNVDDYATVERYDSSLSEVLTVITSGSLMNLNVWKNIGGFEDKLFIDEVDNDFCLRAIEEGYKIYVTNTIFLSHIIGKYVKSSSHIASGLNGPNTIINISSPFRLYYVSRNGLYVIKKHFKRHPGYAILKVKSLLFIFYKVLVSYPRKRSCFRFIGTGILHFIFGRYGIYKIPTR